MQAGSKGQENRHKTGWLRWLTLGIAWLIAVSLARDVWEIRTGFNRITEAEERLEAEKKKNSDLRARLELVTTQGYKEKLIREKLNMQKWDEVIVVMPGRVLAKAEKKEEIEEVANWKKWWNLIR